MNLVTNNPFRILDLPITAGEREIAKQISTLVTYAEMGKIKSFDTDFPFMPPVERTPIMIEEAKKQIEQGESKLFYSLFWFWKCNSVDELAFEVLKEGNTEKAISIWEKSVLSNKTRVLKPIVSNENLIVSSSHFDNVDDESHFMKKNGDEYIVERKLEDNYSIPSAFYELLFEDNWTIECDTKWLEGNAGWSYGIVFGRAKGSYYFFGVNATGSYIYAKYDDWTYTPYIEWKENNNINNRGANKLRIDKEDNILKFFINGEYVDTWKAEPFFGKFFGFKVTSNQKISFRNFKLCKLVEDDTYGVGLNVSLKNLSNIKNLSTLYLGLSLASSKGNFKINHFKKGLSLAKNIFDNGEMETYAKLIAGERYSYNSEKLFHFYLNDIIESVKPVFDKDDGISVKEFISLFSTFPTEAYQYVKNRFTASQIQNIDKEIELAEGIRKKSGEDAADAGRSLVKNTKADIAFLNEILEETDFQYQILADKLSLAIVQCGVNAFNACKDGQGEIDYAKAIKSEEGYLSQYEYALKIAVTQRTKERAQENVDTCKKYIEDKIYYNCWFCGTNEIDKRSPFEITIYKETSRNWIFDTNRRVEYSYVSVSIPRCIDCQMEHRKNPDKFILTVIGFGIAGITIGALINGNWIPGVIVGVIIGWIFGESQKAKEIVKTGIKDTSYNTIKEYPVIKQKLNEGWQFSKPTA